MQPNGDWQQMRERILSRWPGLPAQELDQTRGERSAVLDLIATQMGSRDAMVERELDIVLMGERGNAASRGAGGQPLVAGEPTDAANAVEGTEYAEGDQGAHGIGQEGTPMADASTPPLPSMGEQGEQPQRRAG